MVHEDHVFTAQWEKTEEQETPEDPDDSKRTPDNSNDSKRTPDKSDNSKRTPGNSKDSNRNVSTGDMQHPVLYAGLFITSLLLLFLLFAIRSRDRKDRG